MNRRTFVLFGTALFAGACTTGGGSVQLGPDGKPVPQIYRIDAATSGNIPFRFLDSINTLRAAKGLSALTYSSQLNAAAETHSRDMSLQNRPWHFGSDGSSPLVRVQRVNYPGRLVGENISETYQTELETLSAWMQQPDTRAVIMEPAARELGFSWFQEDNGKIWWTMVTGA